MTALNKEPIPVTVITGFLGVGKTTAILHLFQYKPKNERWAILVNEFGDIGIDGSTLTNESDYAVREIAGGCICCTSGPMMRIALVRMLREEKPDRVLIEPTGLANPAAVLDILRTPGIRDLVRPTATICLVNPRHIEDQRYRDHETWMEQIQVADILVANQCDLASPEQIRSFFAFSEPLFPPKVEIATSQNGRLDPKWLQMDPRATTISRHKHVHARSPITLLNPSPLQPSHYASPEAADNRPNVASAGWIFPVSQVFERQRLEDLLHDLLRPEGLLPKGALRIKGVFRTPRAWLLANGTPNRLQWSAINHRRDSRVEILTEASPPPDWEPIEQAFANIRWTPKRGHD